MKKILPDNPWTAPVSAISGISAGGKREQQLAKLGISTVGDLICHFPRAYQHRDDVRDIISGLDGEMHSYILTVVTAPSVLRPRKGMQITRFRASDQSGTCEICFFNRFVTPAMFPVGARFRFYGRAVSERGSIKIYSPAYEALTGDLRGIVPVYGTTAGLSQKMLSSAIEKASAMALPHVKDFISDETRMKRELATLRYAYAGIHLPSDDDELKRSRKRLVYDEFFLFAARMRLAREERRTEHAPRFGYCDMTPFLSSLGYELTGAQKRAVESIENDLCGSENNIPMCRIVVGDVGCGKTAVAAAASYMCVKNGYQCVLMAPTEILARQHYEDFSRQMSSLGINVTLLIGSMKAAEKRMALKECIGDGGVRADIIIGTHALIEDSVRFARLGLVITDEQHRFGAMQRAKLSEKGGDGVHTLVMSATPIPRTLSLAMYGDLDISMIDEMPPGRQRVDTFTVDESYRDRLNAFIRKQVSEGHQVYVVCPAVGGDNADPDDEDGDEKMKAAVEYAEKLKNDVFPDLNVGFIHGKMKGNDKDSVMQSFAGGDIDILVSTTVIEVGVNVPNATLMIVENAERFGLSQLHQLRGRVGRGSDKSYCILVSEAAKNEGSGAFERLHTMKTEYNGFKIAERDLAMRGPGDFLPKNGTVRQSGSFGFRLADTGDADDMSLLKFAFADAGDVLTDDPTLSKPENNTLRELIVYSEHDKMTIS